MGLALLCALVLASGAGLLVRGLGTSSAGQPPDVLLALVGAGLLGAAAGLALQRAAAWAAACLLALILLAAAGWRAWEGYWDWFALLAGLALLLALASPPVRASLLADRAPGGASTAKDQS